MQSQYSDPRAGSQADGKEKSDFDPNNLSADDEAFLERVIEEGERREQAQDRAFARWNSGDRPKKLGPYSGPWLEKQKRVRDRRRVEKAAIAAEDRMIADRDRKRAKRGYKKAAKPVSPDRMMELAKQLTAEAQLRGEQLRAATASRPDKTLAKLRGQEQDYADTWGYAIWTHISHGRAPSLRMIAAEIKLRNSEGPCPSPQAIGRRLELAKKLESRGIWKPFSLGL